ncbi:MAG: hypothetical protein LBR70_02705 [Lactobacillaceae bacterium]|jgi:hypothetical protein|nr:hypothetical protein [Lactobacillaceae bacterium]
MDNEPNTSSLQSVADKMKTDASERGMDFNLEMREYLSALAADFAHRFAPNRKSDENFQKGMVGVVNSLMYSYYGNLTPENVLSDGDKQFLQSPSMLSYWASKSGYADVIENPSRRRSDDSVILAYYPPLANSYFKRTGDNLADYQNKHFYSHAKSEINDNGMKYVINPELLYQSNIHSENEFTKNVYTPTSINAVDNVEGFAPDDVIFYEVDLAKAGLNKEDVVDGFKYAAAGININDKEISNSLIKYKEAGISSDEIVAYWQKGVDLADKRTVNALVDKKSSVNVDSLPKKDGQKYKYNLQDFNCAVTPVAPLIYASEYKIYKETRANSNFNAGKFRENIGLPNIWDNENFGELNDKFYSGFMKEKAQKAGNAVKEGARKFFKADYNEKKEMVKEAGKKVLSAFEWAGGQALDYVANGDKVLDVVKSQFGLGVKKEEASGIENFARNMTEQHKSISEHTVSQPETPVDDEQQSMASFKNNMEQSHKNLALHIKALSVGKRAEPKEAGRGNDVRRGFYTQQGFNAWNQSRLYSR